MTESRRVDQVANDLGLTPDQVLSLLETVAPADRNASSVVTDEDVALLTQALGKDRADDSVHGPTDHGKSSSASDVTALTETSTDEGVADPSSYLQDLIVQAFDAARASGKPDWQFMSTAVLKNRISQLLGEKFDQRQYGYRRILDLVLDFPNLLAVDQEQNPPILLLLQREEKGEAQQQRSVETKLDTTTQIRPDLWRAIIDYETGEPYLLVNGHAVVASEAPHGALTEGPLPTITPAELAAWRREFATSVRNVVAERPESLDRLEQWADEHKGTRALPGILQGQWNLYLKQAVYSRLRAWYETRNIAMPDDVVVKRETARRPEIATNATEESTLRRLLIECLSRMPYEELRRVQLPASSLLRMRQ